MQATVVRYEWNVKIMANLYVHCVPKKRPLFYCLSTAMRGQNINLPVCVCLCVRKNSNSYIFRSVCQIDMKFDRLLRPATKTLWVVSHGGKTIPKWRMAAILKIVISISQQKVIWFWWNFVHSSRFWTGWTSHDQKWRSCIGQTASLTEHISC